jgi:transcriptional regulator with XRE-family HTH domain
MAETWSKAFGRYLRTLRQRRGLSLQQVSSLSQAFTERVEKGYLSRCENGFQSPAFSKMIPLARIYEVPADVLLERLELDLELDRIGAPDTEGLTYEQATAAASSALEGGYLWRGYALLRDAVGKSQAAPLKASFRDLAEQFACAQMNCATAARGLGRHKFAVHEYHFVEHSNALGPRLQVILWDRLSVCYRNTRQLETAEKYANAATAKARELGHADGLGLALSNQALIAFSRSDLGVAATLFQQAFEAFRSAGLDHSCARCLNNLGQVYFELRRLGAAKRTVLAAERLAARINQPRAQALSWILMGEIDCLEHRDERAAQRWKQAAEIARRLDDKQLCFKAEFFLYKQAQETGNLPAARSLQRRLNRLAGWVPEYTPELVRYRLLQESA